MIKNLVMEASETKLKKQEGIIDILMGEIERLKAELVKYKLIKKLVSNESENFLIERERQSIDLGYKGANQEAQGKAKNSQCWLCGLKTYELFERNRGKSGSYLCCADCYEDVEKDIERIQDREKEALMKNPIKMDKIRKRKRTRKGISKEEAMKHSKPSKNKKKVICKDCGGEYLAVNFHSHYASHIK